MGKKTVLIIASFSGALAIILGALGAHALEAELTPRNLASYKTGSLYHIFHSIVLLVLGFSQKGLNAKSRNVLVWLFLVGIVLFSGSIYLLATRHFLEMEGLAVLGPVTPIGGLVLIAGWISVGVFAYKQRVDE